MEKALRNVLYTTVVKCRDLLERDLARQLEGVYGVHADGAFEPLEGLTHLDAVGRADRGAIEAAIRHEKVAGATRQEAVDRYVRESAFTFLNRLAALKLMEHPGRAMILPSVGAGDQSKGFQQFSLLSPEAMRGQPDPSTGLGTSGGYRLYLELLFDGRAKPRPLGRGLARGVQGGGALPLPEGGVKAPPSETSSALVRRGEAPAYQRRASLRPEPDVGRAL